ncbi:aldo/keto reductase [Chloroflexi bacterium TSY]|nr:aldo/keto reductase [Chloroflexi bacterium TSY]
MDYRSLGRTGVQVSPLCLGCWNFGDRTSPEDAYKIIEHAIDAGINFVDTANSYHRGRSEEVVGEALKCVGKRQQIVLATKVHFRMEDENPNAFGNSRRHIIEQCEASLQRLQTDHLDLYQIHRPMSTIPIDETLRALDDLVRSGKVRYIGTTTFAAWQVVESLWMSKELGLNRFISEQPPYNILDRRIERELLPMAVTFGLAVIPWSPIAGGLLTNKYSRNAPPPADSRLAMPNRASRLNEPTFDVIEALQPLAAAKGCTMSQFALAWCGQQPGVTSPIIGPRTMDHLIDNLDALAITITEEDRAHVDKIVPPGRVISPLYEADFGPHKYR